MSERDEKRESRDGAEETLTFGPEGRPQDPEVEVPPGSRLQHFEILSLLGRGGMGQVYAARDHRLDRRVAIKFLPSVLTADRDRVERFEKEARAASALNHPGIVTIYETGDSEWGPFMVMELIEGRTLDEFIQEGLTLPRVLDLALQTAKAVGAAHEAGIIHRDLKPANILVREDGYLKVVDFGLARLGTLNAQFELTAPGALMGTLKYASPEQGRGEAAGERSDVFSLGLVLYQMATGRHPFGSRSPFETMQAIAISAAEPPSHWNPAVPEELDGLVLSMLEKDAAARPSAPHVVETLNALSAGTAQLPQVMPAARPVVRRTLAGRDAEREQLQSCFQRAEQTGKGTLLCVSGEAGFGKSLLIQYFVDGLIRDGSRHLIGSGRSSERLAGAEPYLPLLEALQELLAADTGGRFARKMKQFAPSWYARVGPSGSLTEIGDLGELAAQARSQDRMKHELGTLMQRVASDLPIILFFDDFHWVDASTADAVVYLADRLETLPLLLVVTYRESELALTDHPFRNARLTLQARGLSRDIALDGLSPEAIRGYLDAEFPGHDFPEELPGRIHQRTGGHPLFVADLTRYLRKKDAIRQEEGVWVLDPSFDAAEAELPESVRSMVERRITLVEEEERRLLTAAAVQGVEFDSAIISQVLSLDAADVEEALERLERLHALVQLIEERELPDRTLNSRYQFAHILYQHAFIDRLRPTRRSALAAATAERLLQHHGPYVDKLAAEMARLFETARDFERAGEFYLKSAASAAAVFAHREAVLMARQGLEAVLSLFPSRGRDALELQLQLTLGGSLCLIEGYTSPDTAAAFSRALELAEEMGEESSGFPVIWGLWMTYAVSGDCKQAGELGRRLMRIAEEADDPIFFEAAHYSLAITHEMLGELPQARVHSERVLGSDVEATNKDRIARFVVDPVSSAKGIRLRTLALLGLSGLTHEAWDDLCATESLEDLDPRSRADRYVAGCLIWAFSRNAEKVRELADKAIETCDRHDIFFERQWAMFWRGWAMTVEGEAEEGLALMAGFLSLVGSAGTLILHSLWFATFAEALLEAGRIDEARAAVGRGLELVEATGQRYFESELYRIQGLVQALPGGEAGASVPALEKALEIARRQSAGLLEARAALSLGRQLRREGAGENAQAVMRETFERVGNEVDTPELSELRETLSKDPSRE